jgi:hypothetical protein
MFGRVTDGCVCAVLLSHLPVCDVGNGPGGQKLLGVRVVFPSHVAVCVCDIFHS